MSAYQTVAVPFQTIGNRQCLTAKQLMEQPWLREFMDCFSHCFEEDVIWQVYWFYPDGVHGQRPPAEMESKIEKEARRIAIEHDLDPDDARLGYPAWQIDWILEAARLIVLHGQRAPDDSQ